MLVIFMGLTSFCNPYNKDNISMDDYLFVYDLKNPYRPELIAYFVPPGPANSRVPAIQMNEVYVDENAIVYAGDRWSGGLYVMEMDI